MRAEPLGLFVVDRQPVSAAGSAMAGCPSGCGATPELDIDMYADDVLRDPIPYLNAIRDAGPVVYLKPNQAYAVGRSNSATEVAKDWKRFTSSHGSGFLDITKPGLLRPTNEMLEADPPQHTNIRNVMQRIMSPATVRRFQGMFTHRAEALIDQLLERECLDGATDIAQAYVLDVFSEVIGIDLPATPAVAVGMMLMNLMGPVNANSERAMAEAEPHLGWLEKAISRPSTAPGGFADITFRAEDDGRLDPGVAKNMVLTFAAGGFDSTIAAIANTLLLLVRNPEQWRKLRADPSLVGAAIDEALRLEPPFRSFYRMTTRDTTLSGFALTGGTKMGVWMGAVNRDPTVYDRPDDYDVTRKGAGAAMAFGTGIHNCIGQILARLEGASIIAALVKKVSKIELAGEPEYRLNNQVRAPHHLPLRIAPA
jgi:cytochrome P450